MFIVLRRREQKRLITSRMDDTVQETGRVRRYFKPTSEALRRLKESRRTLVRLWEGLDATLEQA